MRLKAKGSFGIGQHTYWSCLGNAGQRLTATVISKGLLSLLIFGQTQSEVVISV